MLASKAEVTEANNTNEAAEIDNLTAMMLSIYSDSVLLFCLQISNDGLPTVDLAFISLPE